ncbi:acid-sensing ion channel 5 [Plakobranchus ocellatus]|uniref:Acid-sensing ion channel 5 n=1 Tax=Plakobranchus ocellatus TaxID=259542 RepID=A0AAV4DCI4_9GAST|nr:acid-sensing ion channel 5 [Plakobranchus ocellatus]
MTELYGNNPAPTIAGDSDVDNNCTAAKSATVTAATRRKHRTAKERIDDFIHSTSMRGVQHVMSHRPVWRRMIWSILVIGSAAWAVHNVYQIVSEYSSHPVQTTVSSEYHSKMNFPAVTVCNLNRIRLSKTPQSLVESLQWMIMVGKVDVGHGLV